MRVGSLGLGRRIDGVNWEGGWFDGYGEGGGLVRGWWWGMDEMEIACKILPNELTYLIFMTGF
jgi:hypothetical protein